MKSNLLFITSMSFFTIMPVALHANSLEQQVEQASAMRLFQTIDAQKVRTFSRDILTERDLATEDTQAWETLISLANKRAKNLIELMKNQPTMKVSLADIETLKPIGLFIYKTVQDVAATIGFIQQKTGSSLSEAKTRLTQELKNLESQKRDTSGIQGKLNQLTRLDDAQHRAATRTNLEGTIKTIDTYLKSTQDIFRRALDTITLRTPPSPSWIKLMQKDEKTFKDLDDEAVFKGHEKVLDRYKDAVKNKKPLDAFLTELKAKDPKKSAMSHEKFAETLIDKLERLSYVAQQPLSTLQKGMQVFRRNRDKVIADAASFSKQLRTAYPDIISQYQTYLINTTEQVAATILLAQAGAYQSVLTQLHREITNLIKAL